MTAGSLFWILWLVGLFLGCFGVYRATPDGRFVWFGGLFLYLLVGLLAWATIGAPIKG